MAKDSRQLSKGKGGTALAIHVTPRARRNEIVDILSDQTIKIRLTAPPVEGKANEALIEFLAKVLDVPRSKIDIVAGVNGRDKLVSILGIKPSDAQGRILKHLKS